MMLPQKNGVMGESVLKIVELLKRVRGVPNIFELLDQEQTQIQRKINDPFQQPLNTGASTRMTQTKLEKTFYKELDPFEKEGINWNAFVWRVNSNFRAAKYTN